MRNGYWRVVQDGSVLVNCVRYYVAENYLPYNGRLDGLTCLFHTYPDQYGISPYLALWGTRAYYDGDESDTPQVVDGGYVWDVWTAPASYLYSLLDHADENVRHRARVMLEHDSGRIRAL